MRTRGPWTVRLAFAVLVLAATAAPAAAFRSIPIGHQVPIASLQDGTGRALEVPNNGRVSVLVFWRPGQELSEQAIADLVKLAPGLVAKGVQLVAVAEPGVSGSVGQTARSSIQFAVDHDGRFAQTLGLIVLPSTAIVAPDGRLLYYLPSHPATYAALVEAQALHAGGEISGKELARRLAAAGVKGAGAADAGQDAYTRGVRLAHEGKYEEASAALTEALRRSPEHADAHVELGYVQLELGRPAEALKEFEAALSQQPGLPQARVGRGIAHLRLGDPKKGIHLIEEAVTLNPEPVRGHWELAQVYESMGDLARAIAHYRWAYQKLLQGRK